MLKPKVTEEPVGAFAKLVWLTPGKTVGITNPAPAAAVALINSLRVDLLSDIYYSTI
jgi:hypothetical protein